MIMMNKAGNDSAVPLFFKMPSRIWEGFYDHALCLIRRTAQGKSVQKQKEKYSSKIMAAAAGKDAFSGGSRRLMI